MESLFKPPRARKNSSSFSGPYDGVLLSNRGQKTPSLDYVEIFSGSPSSIPVLDLSGLETGQARQRARSSSTKVDYSSIFGGFRNDDVAAPYEELFNSASSSKEKKSVKPRSSSKSRATQQESVSRHSLEKTEVPSIDHTDQSVDGVQKHFNMSFNKTSQVNTDTSNGQTHIAQLHAVPGFAYFVDGTPQVQKTEKVVVPSLKREVSRTWSFSAEIGKVKSGSTQDKPHILDSKSCDLNEINLKSQGLNVPKPSDDVKDLKKSRVTEIASNGEGSSEKINQIPPTFFDEEDLLDENSAAVALKKAIDQAQEIITVAKMVMERKKKGDSEGRPKARSRSRWKTEDMKETRTELEEAFGYNMEKDDVANCESLNPNSSGVGRKFRSSSGPDGNFVNHGKDNVYIVPKNVETAKVRGEAFDENVMSSSSKEEMVIEKENVEKATEFEGSLSGISNRLPASHNHLMVEEEKIVENVVTTEVCNEVESSQGLIVTKKPVTLEPLNEQISENTMLASNEFESQVREIESENGKLEHLEEAIYHKEGPKAVAELVESEIETSKNFLNVDECVDRSSEEGHETFYDSTGSESMVDVMSTSHHIMQENKISNEADVVSGIYQENGFLEERNNFMENEENNEKKPAEIEKLVNLEDLTTLRSDDDHLSDDPGKFPEIAVIEEEETVGKEQHANPCDVEEDLNDPNRNPAFTGTEEQLDEAVVQNSDEIEPEVVPEVEEIETEVMGYADSGFDFKKQDFALVFDGRNKHVELEEVEIKARRLNTCEDKVAETIHVEANDSAEVQKNEVFVHAIETNDTSEEGRNEESNNECKLHEDACESSTSIEAGDQCPNDVNELHGNDTTPFVETHDACNSRDEDHQKTVDGCAEKNVAIPEIIQIFAAVDGDQEPNESNHSEDDEMHKTEHLHQSSLEEIFTEIKMQNDFGGSSCDGPRPEDDGLLDKSHAYEMPDEEDHDILKESQEYAYVFTNPYLTESLYSNLNRTGCEDTDVTQEPEEVHDANEALSSSSLENTDVLSTHKSEDHVEELKEETSDKNEGNYEPEGISNDRYHIEEQRSGAYTQHHMERKEAERDQETEKPLKTEPKMEENENLSESSTIEEKGNKENTQDFNIVDYRQRIEDIKREKEREKNRIAAERAIREARERAFAEARERAERAAVERATAEARQRVLAETKERQEKSSTSTAKQTVNKTSNDAKLKAERAAVERVLAEARERAREKVMSQKNKTQVDKVSGERFSSGTSRVTELKHSFSSSDLENIDGANTESALRNKARLERHQRIMERVAKALAEKNMRDLIAQKEQAERNRLSESLDAEIKRWASGKEGNLRALLSTLQYILGPKSGWQPISLTEIITSAAVKKAYRKATLYVHPDKLQQRGASIQQKYICEKVFDLLKAAWNKFNSEER